MKTLWWSEIDSPIGRLGLGSTEAGLRHVTFDAATPAGFDLVEDDGRNTAPATQLDEYFGGRRRAFDLALDFGGTPFQQSVWRAVADLPFGTTATYRDVARRIGAPAAVRAVGAANGANPLPIVVPCHRVVGTDGRLHGYAGGLANKQRLLALEDAVPSEGEAWRGWAMRRQRLEPRLLIGPRSTRIYCRPECRYGERISRVPALFLSADEAVERGYRACRVCRP